MPSQIRAGYVLEGKYRLQRPLAQGGMGELWVAEHLTLGEPVAIKLILTNLASRPDMSTRFKREAMAIAKLQRQTQHVVQIHDYGVDDGVPFIVMELLDGEDLDQRLDRIGRLKPAEALSLVAQLTKALQPAHESGIVHRDLKLANIFLARVGDDEIVKVLDFGLAKGGGLDVVGDHTAPGDVLGSPRYMSPEQARGTVDLDGRSDLWSVAVLLFIALTGEPPFQSKKFGDLLLKICTEPAPVPSSIAPELSPAIDAFFRRALSKERDDRFASARDFLFAFGEAVGAEADVSSPGLGAYERFSHPAIGGRTDDTTRRVTTDPEMSFPEISSIETHSFTPAGTRMSGGTLRSGVPRSDDSMGGTLTRPTHQIDRSQSKRAPATTWLIAATLVLAAAVIVGLIVISTTALQPAATPAAADSILSDSPADDDSPTASAVAAGSASTSAEVSPAAPRPNVAAPAVSQRRPDAAAASSSPPAPLEPSPPQPPPSKPRRDAVFGF